MFRAVSTSRLPLLLLACAAAWASTNARASIDCAGDDLGGVPERANIDFATTIQPIINQHCAGCHTGGARLGSLNLDARTAVANLVNVPSTITAAGIPRVKPGSTQESFLFKKINCTNLQSLANAAYGERMPAAEPGLPFHAYLSPTEQGAIRDWILQGAHATAVAPQGTPISGGTSGNWFDPTPNQAGHGFQIEVLPNNAMLAIWFVFDPAGHAQSWIFAQGNYDTGANTVTLAAALEQGGAFPPNFDSSHLTVVSWGSLTFTFDDCDHGTATWHSNAASAAAGYADVSFPIQRLTRIEGTACQ